MSKNRIVSDIEKLGKRYFFVHFGYTNRNEYTFATKLEAMIKREEILFKDLKSKKIVIFPTWKELLKTNLFKNKL